MKDRVFPIFNRGEEGIEETSRENRYKPNKNAAVNPGKHYIFLNRFTRAMGFNYFIT